MQDPAALYTRGYDTRAQAYADSLDPTLRSVHDRVVDLSGCGAGSNVLDIATGTGAIARLAEARGARVTAVDISPKMIDLAKSMGGTISYSVADATRLEFSGGEFDCITCGFAFSHIPQIEKAFAELKRVAKPQGTIVECSWGPTAHCPAFSAVLRVLAKYAGEKSVHAFHGILDEDTWADAAKGVRVLESAGFLDVAATSMRLNGTYPSGAAAVAWVHAWPDYGLTIDNLSASARNDFNLEATAAAAECDLSYWFEINYYTMKNPS